MLPTELGTAGSREIVLSAEAKRAQQEEKCAKSIGEEALQYHNTGAALLTLWVKCVSAERGHGSKSRVHFLGYSLFRVWVTVWVGA